MMLKQYVSKFPLVLVFSLFFMWGSMTCLNDLLIPHFKVLFSLTYIEVLLVQFCFFGAYFLVSAFYYMYSQSVPNFSEKWGYKKLLVLGLFVSGLGCLFFVCATYWKVYAGFLLGLATLASGITLIQIAANPYIILLGDQQGAAGRLNLAQGLNSLGYTLAPLLGGFLLFSNLSDVWISLRSSYVYLTLIFIVLGLIFYIVRIPQPKIASTEESKNDHGALALFQFAAGKWAVFAYVGAEVAIGSILLNYISLPQTLGVSHEKGTIYLSLYWGGLMIGRLQNAAWQGVFGESYRWIKSLIMTLIPLSLVLFLSLSSSVLMQDIWPYLMLCFLAYLISSRSWQFPERLIIWYGSMVLLLLLIAMIWGNALAAWGVIGTGLFHSIMWSNLFSVSTRNLGPSMQKGSSLLIMMIVGGAVIPLVQGGVVDFVNSLNLTDSEIVGMRIGFLVPWMCYAYMVYYAWRVQKNTILNAIHRPV